MRLLFWAFLLLLPSADAGTLAGVTLPDTATVGGQTVSLNGMGLREKYMIDIYVGGLYLTQPTHDGAAAIAADAPKRVVMHFIYSEVTYDQMIETFEEGFGQMPAAASQRSNIELIKSWVPPTVHKGEQIVFDYVPGKGTTMSVAGQVKGTIPGSDFMKLIFGIYLGDHPPTAALKRGLLGQ